MPPYTERPVPIHDIGWAVKQLWNGDRVTRAGWNQRGVFLELHKPNSYSAFSEPYVVISATHGDTMPWTCSQIDLLATDWLPHPATLKQSHL
jgi:hypothetical protein